MFKIPLADKKFSQLNKSDKAGNIYATKNINFDEAGYIKLSNRSVGAISEANNNNFDFPVAFGRTGMGQFNVVTSDQPFTIDLSPSSSALATEDTDTDNPTGVAGSSGVYFNNLWHSTGDTAIFSKSGTTWTNRGGSLTTAYPHPIESFVNRQTIAVGNYNQVKQFNSEYTETISLTLPTNVVVTMLAYSNLKMGIITQPAFRAQMSEAYFFTWDGSSTEASIGYPISAQIVSIVAYKSSWVVITSDGKWLYFNGSGFDEIGTFPFSFSHKIWVDPTFAGLLSNNRGVNVVVDGDLIYAQITSDLVQFGKNKEKSIPNFPSGIWCYDPSVGLHHKYSLSNSLTTIVTTSAVDVDTNIITSATTNVLPTGSPMIYVYTNDNEIGGLQVGEMYFCIKVDTSNFKVASSYDNAIAGTAIDLTSVGGTVSNKFHMYNIVDYSSGIYQSGPIQKFGYSEVSYEHLLWGSSLLDTSLANQGVLGYIVPKLKNTGWFVTPKMESEGVSDTFQKIYLKYRPLVDENQIIVKYRKTNRDGLPVSTYQGSIYGTWTDADTFTTTARLGDVLVGDEVEITNGAGSGDIAHVSSITYLTGTYTVNLDKAIVGATNGLKCTFMIDNWTVLKTLTSATQENTSGYAEIPIGQQSKWMQFKIVLIGNETTVEEIQVINKNNRPSV